MTTRLKDKVSNVRTEACKALITVFKRTNDEGVLESLTDALESDPARLVAYLFLLPLLPFAHTNYSLGKSEKPSSVQFQ